MKSVKDYIPHREPFLFVDTIKKLDNNSIETEYTFSAKNEFYQGHYPQNPITPGVITCEAVFQSAAILISAKIGYSQLHSAGTPVLTRIMNAKFKGAVKPDETVTITAEIIENLQKTWFLKGKVKKDQKTILTLEFSVTLTEDTI